VAQRHPKPENARDHILETAVALLRAEGFEALSQTRVARLAGVSQGHLTYYFPKKSDLLIAVARSSVEAMAAELAEFYQSDGWPGADASTRERVTAFTIFMVKDRERTRMLLSLVMQSEKDPALREILLRQVRDLQMLNALGMGRSVDDPEVDLVLATLWGIAIQHLLFSGVRPDEHTDRLVERLLYWDTPTPPKE
jgi:AcrR family transcriptional regulator